MKSNARGQSLTEVVVVMTFLSMVLYFAVGGAGTADDNSLIDALNNKQDTFVERIYSP